MNSSLVTAGLTPHLKIIAVAMLAVTLVMWIAIGARLTLERGALSGPRFERSFPASGLAREL